MKVSKPHLIFTQQFLTAFTNLKSAESESLLCRSLLMDAFASALQLPDGALPPAGPKRSSDDVFIRLMGLHKGRKMLARTIRYRLSVPCSRLSFTRLHLP